MMRTGCKHFGQWSSSSKRLMSEGNPDYKRAGVCRNELQPFLTGATVMRSVLFVVGFAVGLSSLLGATPVHAAQSCEDFCAQNRCAHGSVNPIRCMHNCVPSCQAKRAGQKKQ